MGISPMAWSPLGGGRFGDGTGVDPRFPNTRGQLTLLELLDKLAANYGIRRSTLSLAWQLKHPSHIIPIVGSVRPERIKEEARADGIDLSREDWYRILIAARMEGLP
jgi:predicted oxidoreductase